MIESSRAKDITVPYFTIYTPSYNRASTLIRAYESLLAQSFTDFEWLIIDDGSVDNTREVVERWIEENKLPIRYYYQENQGKHIATNNAVNLAKAKMFIVLDSDDSLIPDALRIIHEKWEEVPDDIKPTLKGVAFRCFKGDSNEMHGGTDNRPMQMDISDFEFRLHYCYKGEGFGCNRIDVLKQYPFPRLDKRCKFCPEDIIWFEIGKKYNTRYFNIAIRRKYDDTENAITGKSTNRAFANYYGWMYVVNNLSRYIIYNPKRIVQCYVGVTMDGLLSGRSMTSILSDANGLLKKIGIIAFSPIGWILYRKRK